MTQQAFWRAAGLSLFLLVVLIGLRLAAPVIIARAGEQPRILVERLLNPEQSENTPTGYYEALMDDADQLAGSNSSILGRLLGGQQFVRPRIALLQRRSDFLVYGYEISSYHDLTWLSTNRFGMADREYTLNGPSHTRRIALFGDSLTRGYGATPNHSWKWLLEDYLNQAETNDNFRSYQILNFAVDGYKVTQLVEVALDKAASFEPDVNVVALSESMVAPQTWSTHLATLLRDGRDLKYDYLKEINREAHFYPGASLTRYYTRLRDFRLPTFRWALSQIGGSGPTARPIIVVLLPSLNYKASTQAEGFDDIQPILNELGIPMLDVRDTFAGIGDLDAIRYQNPVGGDPHPNDRGYQLVFENLYRKLRERPEILALLLGHQP